MPSYCSCSIDSLCVGGVSTVGHCHLVARNVTEQEGSTFVAGMGSDIWTKDGGNLTCKYLVI